jgi:serine/threonine protein phosphatase PrpC
LTKDHRPDDPDEIARIEKAGGFMFKGRVVGVLAITRSLGDHCMKSFVIAEPYCSDTSITLLEGEASSETQGQEEEGQIMQPSSFVICACDGLWDVFEDQEAVDFVNQYGHERERIAEYLVNEAVRKGSTDNVSVIVAWL